MAGDKTDVELSYIKPGPTWNLLKIQLLKTYVYFPLNTNFSLSTFSSSLICQTREALATHPLTPLVSLQLKFKNLGVKWKMNECRDLKKCKMNKIKYSIRL